MLMFQAGVKIQRPWWKYINVNQREKSRSQGLSSSSVYLVKSTLACNGCRRPCHRQISHFHRLWFSEQSSSSADGLTTFTSSSSGGSSMSSVPSSSPARPISSVTSTLASSPSPSRASYPRLYTLRNSSPACPWTLGSSFRRSFVIFSARASVSSTTRSTASGSSDAFDACSEGGVTGGLGRLRDDRPNRVDSEKDESWPLRLPGGGLGGDSLD
ncbi:hypothetical protein JB92DRAFT_1567691 [Gautieria morchelliformis]|nr:hypothetical protein JB92DRAFT_1567691 [Gautieria morchelliformis]